MEKFENTGGHCRPEPSRNLRDLTTSNDVDPYDIIPNFGRLVGELEDLGDPVSEARQQWEIDIDALPSADPDVVCSTDTLDDFISLSKLKSAKGR